MPSGVTAAVADFADGDSLRRVLEGVDSIYLVCSPVPQLVEWEGNMIEACKKMNVKRVVLNSALGAGNYAKSFPSWHAKVEDRLTSSGLSWTILRPNSFMQNVVTYYAPTIRSQNAFYSSVGSACMSYIDVRDIAAIAAKSLTADSHAGKTYELNGPEALTAADVAGKISRLTGRGVQYVDIPFEAQRKSLQGMGMPEWQVNALLELQEYYTQGNGAQVDGVVEKLTGQTSDADGRIPRGECRRLPRAGGVKGSMASQKYLQEVRDASAGSTFVTSGAKARIYFSAFAARVNSCPPDLLELACGSKPHPFKATR